MSRRSLFALLLFSLSCFGQNVVVYGGYATSGSPALGQPPVYAPAMVPSNVALPGSGPPMGAPISNLNDSRTSGVVQVYTPPTVIETPVAPAFVVAAPRLPSGEAVAGEPTTGVPAAGVPGAQLGFNAGLGKFEGAITAQAQAAPQRSLADVANQYRSRPRGAARTITNENVDRLKGVQGTPAPQPPQSDIQHEMAKAAALPPVSAGNAAPEAKPESPQSPVLSAQVDQKKRTPSAETATVPAGTAPEAQPPTVAQSVEQEQQSTAASQLPATHSQLPLLAVLGLLVSGAGVTYLFRR